MLKSLGACNGNTRAISRLYTERTPNRRHHSYEIILVVQQLVREYGILNSRYRIGGRPQRLTWGRRRTFNTIRRALSRRYGTLKFKFRQKHTFLFAFNDINFILIDLSMYFTYQRVLHVIFSMGITLLLFLIT